MDVQRLKTRVLGLAAFIAAAIVTRSILDHGNDIRSARTLLKVASDMNRSLPVMVDKVTELSTTTAIDGVLIYNYRLLGVSARDIDTGGLIASLKPQVVNGACSFPGTRGPLLNKGVTLRYAYYDEQWTYLASVDVLPTDCVLATTEGSGTHVSVAHTPPPLGAVVGGRPTAVAANWFHVGDEDWESGRCSQASGSPEELRQELDGQGYRMIEDRDPGTGKVGSVSVYKPDGDLFTVIFSSKTACERFLRNLRNELRKAQDRGEPVPESLR